MAGCPRPPPMTQGFAPLGDGTGGPGQTGQSASGTRRAEAVVQGADAVPEFHGMAAQIVLQVIVVTDRDQSGGGQPPATQGGGPAGRSRAAGAALEELRPRGRVCSRPRRGTGSRGSLPGVQRVARRVGATDADHAAPEVQRMGDDGLMGMQHCWLDGLPAGAGRPAPIGGPARGADRAERVSRGRPRRC